MTTTELETTCDDHGNGCAQSVREGSGNPPLASPSAPSPPHAPPTPKPPAPENGHHRGGAPRGNQNATKSGLRGSQFPPKCKAEAGHVQRFCRRVKAEYEAKHGPMTAHAEAILHRLRRAMTKDRLAARWLRLEDGKLTIEERMKLTDAMSAAAEAAEKCLRLLKLDMDHAAGRDLWDEVDRPRRSADTATTARQSFSEKPQSTPAAQDDSGHQSTTEAQQ